MKYLLLLLTITCSISCRKEMQEQRRDITPDPNNPEEWDYVGSSIPLQRYRAFFYDCADLNIPERFTLDSIGYLHLKNAIK